MNRLAEFGYPEFVAQRLTGLFDLSPTFSDGYVHLWRYRYTVMRGRKYHRIVRQSSLQDGEVNWDSEQRSVACFVDDEGNVYMAAGWKGPAKGVRYNVSTQEGVNEFFNNANPYGSYLYHDYKKKVSA